VAAVVVGVVSSREGMPTKRVIMAVKERQAI